MELGDLWKWIEKIWPELPMIRQVWKTMLTLIFLVVVVLWWIFEYRFSDSVNSLIEQKESVKEQMSVVEKTNDFLQAQLDSYQNKFPNQTPEEILKQVEGLREKLTKFEPRQITETEKARIIPILDLKGKPTPKIEIFCNNDVESNNYCKQWVKILIESGWTGVDKEVIRSAVSFPPFKGVIIGVKNKNIVGAGNLQKAFKSLGINAQGVIKPALKENTIMLDIGEKG